MVLIGDDRHATQPWGANGGKPGDRSRKMLVRADGTRQALPAKIDGLAVEPGDRIIFQTAAGGGYGEPLLRDPSLVVRDVATGMVTNEAAASDYGVVIDAGTGRLDLAATADLRAGLGREQPHRKLFDRGDLA